ncbi:hypothetical protein BJG93_07365 [Paraburkholderia sprentiae WSM5005]|uniref:Uncharacterized protein n=1 Tax=Paraburkholderia sprentiae WSM5005 TaxID=754502 RepID=A0A1I9YFZ1_9BURK|nr:hypothetical protein [Paraburkholderia sprentiae]APA85224.1 hypothetical protein BJG93_07365 [Paraburkholderia sprentiae WSM5005]
MIELVLMCFVAGMVVGLPVWIVWQRVGARRGLAAMRGFNPRDAVPCGIEPVALRARLLPALDDAQHEVSR